MISGFNQPSVAQGEQEEQPFVPDLMHGFGASPAAVSEPAASPEGEAASYLNASTSFKGLLKSSRSVGIDGRFEGEIQSEADLVVGRQAEVRANIKANNVIISGKVVGNIHCSSLEIQANGRVIGNITAGSLLISMGAVFRGQSFMGAGEDTEQVPEPLIQAGPNHSSGAESHPDDSPEGGE